MLNDLIYEKIGLGKVRQPVNRTRGFVNQNRFKSGKAIKQLNKISHDKHKKIREERGQGKGQ